MSAKTVRKIILIAFGVLVSGGSSYLINHWRQERYRRITVGRDTTYVTGPRFADGTIDCLGAINAKFSAGVTPENNAAVPLYLATNPKDFLVGWELEAFRSAVGVKEFPDPAKTYIDFSDFMFERAMRAASNPQEVRNHEGELRSGWLDHVDTRRHAPWKREDDPDAYEWLARNGPALELVVSASKRERFYAPLIGRPGLGTTLNAKLIDLVGIRANQNLLGMRAMLALGNQDFAAWRTDVVAQERLGRLVMRAPSSIQALVGISMVNQADSQVAEALAVLTPQEARTTLADLRALSAWPDIVDCDDQCVRLETIAEIAAMARFGPRAPGLNLNDPAVPLPAPASFGFQPPIHFDDLLREYNRLYDRRIAAARLPTYSQRRAAFDVFEADRVDGYKKIAGNSSTAAIERLIYTAIERPGAHSIAQDRAMEKSQLVRAGLMVVIYRSEHGEYPKVLSDVPGLAETARDIFADDGPVHYVPEDGMIYSVGPNQKDDGGRQVRGTGAGTMSFDPAVPAVTVAAGLDDIAVRLK